MHEPDAPIVRAEVCSVAQVRRVAAMLDVPPDDFNEGGKLPRGWHFFMLAGDARRSDLRADGFPGLGVAMPELGLPRLLLGGREVVYRGDVPIGVRLVRTSSVERITQKSSGGAPMAVATIAHSLRIEGEHESVIDETQTYLLLPARARPAPETHDAALVPSAGERTKTIVPDETLLFQYSALGFNSHKIHIDKSHARDAEGYPDLVVNGGLSTLLLTEFVRSELALRPAAIRVRHVKPLFCGSPMTLVARRDAGTWHLKILNDKNVVAVEAEVESV